MAPRSIVAATLPSGVPARNAGPVEYEPLTSGIKFCVADGVCAWHLVFGRVAIGLVRLIHPVKPQSPDHYQEQPQKCHRQTETCLIVKLMFMISSELLIKKSARRDSGVAIQSKTRFACLDIFYGV